MRVRPGSIYAGGCQKKNTGPRAGKERDRRGALSMKPLLVLQKGSVNKEKGDGSLFLDREVSSVMSRKEKVTKAANVWGCQSLERKSTGPADFYHRSARWGRWSCPHPP